MDKSIDELTKSYNQRLHLEETQPELDDEEMDEDNCELEESNSYEPRIETDFELQRRILGMSNIILKNF